jgi:hypothetical protein
VMNCIDQGFSPFSTSNLKCRSTWKLFPMKSYTTFILGEFEVFRWNLENATKVLEGLWMSKGLTWGFDHSLTKGWPLVCVDLIKMVISDCWLGFRGDDPGLTEVWPKTTCWTWLTRSLALK